MARRSIDAKGESVGVLPARRTIALAALLAAMLAGRAARADGTPSQPPVSGTPSEPPSALPPPTSPPVATATAPQAGFVRVHLRAFRKRDTARLYVHQGSDRWALACSSPCKADVAPGALVRVTLGDDYDEPHDFSIQAEAGREIEIEVKPASKGALAGGIVMTSLGGCTALVGLLLVAIGNSGSTIIKDKSAWRTAGWITTVIGAGLTVGGIVMIANRSHEPRVKQDNNGGWGRTDESPRRSAVLEDTARPNPAVTGLPPVLATPLSFDLTF